MHDAQTSYFALLESALSIESGDFHENVDFTFHFERNETDK